jgi:hypothetical protein
MQVLLQKEVLRFSDKKSLHYNGQLFMQAVIHLILVRSMIDSGW